MAKKHSKIKKLGISLIRDIENLGGANINRDDYEEDIDSCGHFTYFSWRRKKQ